MARPKSNGSPKDSTATIGFEAKLWLAADKLRNNLDAAGTSGASKTARRGSPQGERGGVHQFYTPSCVVRCLVEMLAPCKGRIYDPACGSGGSLRASRLCGVRFAEKDRAIAHGVVQSEKFVESHGGTGQRDSASSKSEATLPGLKGNRGDISIYGQDKWARRQRPFGLAPRARRVRLRRQQPKQSNATIHHLAPHGMAGFVLANGSMSSNQSGECVARSASSKPEAKLHGLGRQRDIRRALIEADLVDCMVALPGQLFYSTQIPVCLWFIEKNGNASAKHAAFKTAQIQYNDAMGKAHSNFQLT